MKKNDLLKVFALAKSLWSSFKIPEDELDLATMTAVWYEELLPYDYEIIKIAMVEHAKISDFLNIAKVADTCFKIVNNDNPEINEEKIFLEIKQSIDYYNCKKNFENLSPIAKAVVGSSTQLASWATCSIESISVIESNIRKSIRAMIENYKLKFIVEQKLPQLAQSKQGQISFKDKNDENK